MTEAEQPTEAPRAPIDFAPADVTSRRTNDGGLVLESRLTLGQPDPHLAVMWRRWAEEAPQRTFLAERDGEGGWRRITWSEAARMADAVAQALIDRDLGPDRPVMILSGNSVDHALLMLGALQAGVPVAPVSPAYSLMSDDFGKLKHIHQLLEPGLVYAHDGPTYERALSALELGNTEVVVSARTPEHGGATSFKRLLETKPGPSVERALSQIGPDTTAKILFTSGSTDMPKGVINTHRMLCSNQQAIRRCWPFLEARPPVLVDWLPWNHTFGANHNFNLILRNGGTLYIDNGKPRPGLVEETVRNLREISPTIYFNVPAGFGALLPYLESDEQLRRRFFQQLDLIFYAGAALPQDLWERLEEVSVQARGERVPMTSAWGATETAPLATSAHFELDRAGNIGVPAPGTQIKLAPSGGKMELRVKGPNVTPGYWRQPELTYDAYDTDGFYHTGDAGKLVDPDDPSQGILFDGRVAEDFKLYTGSWVNVGWLRVTALSAASPALQDAVVTGHDRSYVGLLAWPNTDACRQLVDAPADEPVEQLIQSDAVRRHVAEGLRAHNEANDASSSRIERVVLMAEPPSIDAGEITDKGYVNQRATLERRAHLVEALYAEQPGDEVIVVGK